MMIRNLSQIIFPQEQSRAFVGYVFAFAATLSAFLLRVILEPLLHDRSPLLLFALAITASAIRGGFRLGALATVLSVVGAAYFLPPERSFLAVTSRYRAATIFQLVELAMVGLILSWLSGALLNLRWQAMRLAGELRNTLTERDAALAKVRILSGLLPICAGCKKIRDEQGTWQRMEAYISDHSQAQFSHGLCPECAEQYWKDIP